MNSTSRISDEGESQIGEMNCNAPDLRKKVLFSPGDGNQSETESVQSNFIKPSDSDEYIHDRPSVVEESFIWDTNDHNYPDIELESEGESYKC